MIKFRRFFGFVLLFLSFFNMPAMGMEVQVNEEAFFNQKFPSAVVSGKIVFQSNRDGALSEIWVLENGQMRKIASGKNTDENVPKQLSGSLAGMLGGAFADLSEPRWSPDGKSILCLRDKQLVILDVNGAIQSEIQPAKYPLSARWASDGFSVYYTAADRLPKGGGSQNIYLLNLADKSEKRITDLPPLPGVRPILSFAISSDDKRIVMTSMGEKSISIWTVNTDGSDFKMLVKYAREPNWSPDGKKIAYSSSFLPNG